MNSQSNLQYKLENTQPEKGRPVRLNVPIPFNLVPFHRNHSCISYMVCLTYAATSGWPSFTCRYCKDFIFAVESNMPIEGRVGDGEVK